MQAAKSLKRGRKFPFKARSERERDEVNRKISVALSGVDNMVFDLARTILPPAVTEDDIHEAVQLCRIHLWKKSMPKYNAWLDVKISTFLHTCISNFMKQERRKMVRQRTLVAHFSQAGGHQGGVAAVDTSMDRKIEALSRDILASPERYMTPAQVTVFTALVDNPDMMMKTLAGSLGYARASSLSMIKRRIRERLMEVDIEEFLAAANEGPADPAGGG